MNPYFTNKHAYFTNICPSYFPLTWTPVYNSDSCYVDYYQLDPIENKVLPSILYTTRN